MKKSKTTKATESKTSKTLYLCDNGAIYCWDHLGMTAKATGFDLSGRPIVPVNDRVRRDFERYELGEPTCERCDAERRAARRNRKQ